MKSPEYSQEKESTERMPETTVTYKDQRGRGAGMSEHRSRVVIANSKSIHII